MKIVVAVVVYNRIDNIRKWVKIWQKCQTEDAQLVIIHTGNDLFYLGGEDKCENGIIIRRPNQGFDIGCMQDVFENKLPGFPDYNLLLWCTDDTFPMDPIFIDRYRARMQPQVGIVAMKISTSVAPHVRTTGFMIRKEVASKVRFPENPMKSKQGCYLFEHKGKDKTLTEQVRKLGYDIVQVSSSQVSPMWDQGYWRRLDRENEFNEIWGFKKRQDKVTFICTIYNTYPQIISSLLLQTHENWELLLIHDGPNDTGIKKLIPNDKRITFIETKERKGDWGHSLRKWALEEIRQGRLSDPDYIVIGNADNYHVPVYTEYLLKGFKKSHTAVATYSDKMVHSYKAWDIIQAKFERGFLDCASVMVRRDIACEVGWRDIETHSSDWTYFSDIASRYHSRNFIPVKGCLLIHN